MEVVLRSVLTRFRAYQLGNPGSSFSFYANGRFTLLEARLTEVSRPQVAAEMAACGVSTIDKLHITSWDGDHCRPSELRLILDVLRPTKIETPGYRPYSETALTCQNMIFDYRRAQARRSHSVSVVAVTPDYIESLGRSDDLAFRDIFYGPRHIDPNVANDNSTVKLFRTGSFNVLSLGDVESTNISSYLSRRRILSRETDVMILAHHGADNGFTNKKLIKAIDPSIAVCSSDYCNMYDHPRQEIRDLLYERGIPLYTTKTGDVSMVSIAGHVGDFRVTNYKENSASISSERDFIAKKKEILSMNLDSRRNLYRRRPNYPR